MKLLRFSIAFLILHFAIACAPVAEIIQAENQKREVQTKVVEEVKPKQTRKLETHSFKEILGNNADESPYDESGFDEVYGGPVREDMDLLCDFEQSCCWTNDEKNQKGSRSWALASGSNDVNTFYPHFYSRRLPDGNCLAATSTDRNAQLIFESCSILCADETVFVTLSHWQTSQVVLEICVRDFIDKTQLLNCQTVDRISQPGPTTLEFPPGEVFNIVIIARNFSENTESMALIDDLKVEYSQCLEKIWEESSEQEKSIESTEVVIDEFEWESETEQVSTTPAPPDHEECYLLACNFENGHTCGYFDAESYGLREFKATKPFEIKSPFGNHVTGIRRKGGGDFFAVATGLGRGDSAVLIVDHPNFLTRRSFSALYFEAIRGLELRICCNSMDNCPFRSGRQTAARDRRWREVVFECPKGTNSVFFVCDNKGSYTGSCGIDEIKLVDDSKNDLCRNAASHI